ncbi:helix-turn-helix domain-containing protein [Mycobacterium avium subsp. hominissuis]|nr:helix-turn-helix domain-containing protein [Mycobacterium avium]MDO2354675.1 helix-turn-helix domain-containing protein [Mycobacterium avium subsp. hominissuis]
MGEAADISRLSVATLRRRISEGALAAHRVGPRVLRVDRDSLLALIGSPIRGD